MLKRPCYLYFGVTYRLGYQDSVHMNLTVLRHSMSAINSLVFDKRIPCDDMLACFQAKTTTEERRVAAAPKNIKQFKLPRSGFHSRH